MKPFLFFTGLFLFLACFGNVSAQYFPGQHTTIFDTLQEKQPGKGEVTIDQPLNIKNMVGARQSGRNVETSDGRSFLKTQGYRVQVFSGNNQRTSKDEAFQKEQQIKEAFPDLKTYVTYTAPFWRLRVGDYSSHDEAYHTQRQIAEALPSFGKEMYIVREEIQIPLDYYFY
ncbi:MAG: SPOR domain-containing protein [Tannerellaceae bacterium]|nr:SPOR domain-containing protein [Tannerellaceae bacterium]